jgi:cytochrome c oxidase subunit 2
MDKWINPSVDSTFVLWGQFIIYTIYCLIAISLIAWFATRVTKQDSASKFKVSPKMFYSWLILLIVIGVGLHITTLLTIPWSRVDLSGTGQIDQHVYLTIGWDSNKTDTSKGGGPNGAPAWSMPTNDDGTAQVPVVIQCDTLVQFSVWSVAEVQYTTDYATEPAHVNADATDAAGANGSASRPALTYGFGIFHQDADLNNTALVAQEQVVPTHDNNLTWLFDSNGDFNIMSTEYSGPLGTDVTVKSAIHVTGCN